LELALAFKSLISVTHTPQEDDVRLTVFEPGNGGNIRYEFFIDPDDDKSVIMQTVLPGEKTDHKIGDVVPEHQRGVKIL